jgi:polysaccharide pyruvyl transferase WcaK-like protein
MQLFFGKKIRRGGALIKKYIVLGSANGSRNLGDECMWESAIQLLEEIEPGAEIVTDGVAGWQPSIGNVKVLPILAQEMRVDAALHPFLSRKSATNKIFAFVSKMGRTRRARGIVDARISAGPSTKLETLWFDEIAQSDALIISGAGAMTDRYDLQGIHSWRLLSHWASKLGKPVIFLGQGVGPVRKKDNRESISLMLADCTLFTTRDQLSSALIKELSGGLLVAESHIDLAALRVITEAESAMADEEITRTFGDEPFICLNVHLSASTAPTRFLPSFFFGRRLATQAFKKGLNVLFISNMTGRSFNDDRRMGNMIRNSLPKSVRRNYSVHHGQSDSGIVMAMIAQSSGLITTRYHPFVFALTVGVPAAGIYFDEYYRLKFAGAMQSTFPGRGSLHSIDGLKSAVSIGEILSSEILTSDKIQATGHDGDRISLKKMITAALDSVK